VSLYVLDTDTVTFLQARRELVLRRVATIAKDSLYTTVITLREQLRGRLAIVEQAPEGPALVQAYERLYATSFYFSRINVLPFTIDAVIELANLRKQKVRIGTQDLRIAALVLAVDGILVTSNRQDYDKVPGLTIEDWNR